MEILEMLRKKIDKKDIFSNEDMSKHTTFKTGGKADTFVKVDSIENLKYVLQISKENNIPLFILGNGSNILVTDKGIRGIVCQIDIKKFEIKEKGKYIFVTCGSGEKNGGLAQKLLQEEIEGFEFASGIPGTIGGAVKMNAGAFGKEMKDIVYSTKYMDYDGNIHEMDLDGHKFEYRKSIFDSKKYIILETTLKLKKGNKAEIENKMKDFLNQRKEKQPYDKHSAGSTFKRGKDFITAKLIDECGLRGKQIGGAKVSEKHAGFIVNEGSAASQDILDLIKFVQEEVYKQTGKNIELEIEVIGEE